MAGDDAGDAVEAVLGGVAGDAGVDDVVVEALGVEEMLEVVRVGLAGLGAVAGGEGVAEADEKGAGVGGRGSGVRRWDWMERGLGWPRSSSNGRGIVFATVDGEGRKSDEDDSG